MIDAACGLALALNCIDSEPNRSAAQTHHATANDWCVCAPTEAPYGEQIARSRKPTGGMPMKLFSSATRGVIFGSVLGWAFTWILSLALLVLSFAVFPAAPPFWLHLLLFSFLCFIVPALAGVACGLWGARIAKRQMHSEWTQIAATELSRLETPATILISLASSYLLMLLLALLGTIRSEEHTSELQS